MIGFKSHGGTEGAGATGFLRGGVRGPVRSLGVVTWRSVPNWFDPNIHREEVMVEKSRVRWVILL